MALSTEAAQRIHGLVNYKNLEMLDQMLESIIREGMVEGFETTDMVEYIAGRTKHAISNIEKDFFDSNYLVSEHIHIDVYLD